MRKLCCACVRARSMCVCVCARAYESGRSTWPAPSTRAPQECPDKNSSLVILEKKRRDLIAWRARPSIGERKSRSGFIKNSKSESEELSKNRTTEPCRKHGVWFRLCDRSLERVGKEFIPKLQTNSQHTVPSMRWEWMALKFDDYSTAAASSEKVLRCTRLSFIKFLPYWGSLC